MELLELGETVVSSLTHRRGTVVKAGPYGDQPFQILDEFGDYHSFINKDGTTSTREIWQKTNWYVYLVECSDGSFYCGIAKDVKERIAKHNSGKGAKYTRSRLPVKLIGCRGNLSRTEAAVLEYSIKKKPKTKKLSFMLNFPVEDFPKKNKQNA